MKKTLSLIATFLIAAMWSVNGFGGEKYVSGSIGISWFNDSTLDYIYSSDEGEDFTGTYGYGSGITLLGAFGCDYGDYRIEGELGYQQNDIESVAIDLDFDGGPTPIEATSDASVLSLLANGYYDIQLGGGIECYLTAGVGVAQVSIETGLGEVEIDGEIIDLDTEYDASETTLAYQLGAGVGIPVADNIMLDARYRYFATTDFTLSGAIPFDGLDVNTGIESHSALLGLRVGL